MFARAVASLVLLLSSVCTLAQVSGTIQTVPIMNGMVVEISAGHTVCLVVKEDGAPPYIIIRSNRVDLFFEQLDIVRACVRSVIKSFGDKKKQHKIFMRAGEANVNQNTFLQGQYGLVFCRRWQSNDVDLRIEFVLPWVEMKELGRFVSGEILGTCQSNAVPVFPSITEPKQMLRPPLNKV